MTQAEFTQGAGPLAGLLVADFSRVLAGPYSTMLLADLGADVIKVESPAGDDTRRWVPSVTDAGVSTYFLAINGNKRSVALDLSSTKDLAAARELARRADVLAFAAEIGLEPIVLAGQGAAAIPTVRHPVDFSANPPRYDLPPPGHDEHGTEIRQWLTTGAAR